MKKKFDVIDWNAVKKVMGNASVLLICINAYESATNLDLGIIYAIPKKDLQEDEVLRSTLFGYVNSYGIFKGNAGIAKILNHRYCRYAVDTVDIEDLADYAKAYPNLGIAFENYMVLAKGAKHCSIFQDHVKKQDILYNGHYVQCKCSLATRNTKGSFATTNCK